VKNCTNKIAKPALRPVSLFAPRRLRQANDHCQTSDQIRSSDHGILAHLGDIKLNSSLLRDAEGFFEEVFPLPWIERLRGAEQLLDD
jgi:hypothetical protein